MEKETDSKKMTVQIQVPKDIADEFEQQGYVPMCYREQGKYTDAGKAVILKHNVAVKEDVTTQLNTICGNYIDTGLRCLELKYNKTIETIANSLKDLVSNEVRLSALKDELFELQRFCRNLDTKINRGGYDWKSVEQDIINIQNQIEGIIQRSVEDAFVEPFGYGSCYCIFTPYDYVPPFWRECIEIYHRMICLNQKIIIDTFGFEAENQGKLEKIKSMYNTFLWSALRHIKKYKKDLSERIFITQLHMCDNQLKQNLENRFQISVPELIRDFSANFFIPTRVLENLEKLEDAISNELFKGEESSMIIKYEGKTLKLEFIL